VWKKVFEILGADADNGYAMIDRTVLRAHQHSAAPKKDGENQAIGAAKAGVSTKIHSLVGALGHPLAFFLTPGHAHDLEGADALLPQMKANTLSADKAFDADQRVIELLRTAGKTAVIPPGSNRKTQRAYDKATCKRSPHREFLPQAQGIRAIATRYDKTARNFLAAIHLAAAVICLS
jgi:transposase